MSDDLNQLSKTLKMIQQLEKISAGCRQVAEQIDSQPNDINVLRCIRVIMKSQTVLAEVIMMILRENTDKPGASSVPDFGDLLNTIMKQ